jgi:enamine deaminase RidA (YjgF/YER057c/UK114 family)
VSKYSTGTRWEKLASYCRARQVGPHIYVAGTTSVDDDGNIVGAGDMAAQFNQCLDRIEKALEFFGAELKDVVRTRVYLTRMDLFEEYAREHGRRFKGIEPVNTMVEISALVHPDMLVEVEVDAYITGNL